MCPNSGLFSACFPAGKGARGRARAGTWEQPGRDRPAFPRADGRCESTVLLPELASVASAALTARNRSAVAHRGATCLGCRPAGTSQFSRSQSTQGQNHRTWGVHFPLHRPTSIEGEDPFCTPSRLDTSAAILPPGRGDDAIAKRAAAGGLGIELSVLCLGLLAPPQASTALRRRLAPHQQQPTNRKVPQGVTLGLDVARGELAHHSDGATTAARGRRVPPRFRLPCVSSITTGDDPEHPSRIFGSL
jgi:hypothetical protein